MNGNGQQPQSSADRLMRVMGSLVLSSAKLTALGLPIEAQLIDEAVNATLDGVVDRGLNLSSGRPLATSADTSSKLTRMHLRTTPGGKQLWVGLERVGRQGTMLRIAGTDPRVQPHAGGTPCDTH
jgi:hypothetical protein